MIPITTKTTVVTTSPTVDAILETKQQNMNYTLNQSSSQMNRCKFPIAEGLRRLEQWNRKRLELEA